MQLYGFHKVGNIYRIFALFVKKDVNIKLVLYMIVIGDDVTCGAFFVDLAR